jgi:hypothetical protein
MPRMSETVCCPACWKWSALDSATECKRCGTPLIFADGRQVGPVAATAEADGAVESTAPAPARGRWSRLGALLRRQEPGPEAEPAGS